MTRDELHVLIDEVYGANVESLAGSWRVKIYSVPEREIIFTEDFVREYIGTPGARIGELRELLGPTADARHVRENGVLLFSERVLP